MMSIHSLRKATCSSLGVVCVCVCVSVRVCVCESVCLCVFVYVSVSFWGLASNHLRRIFLRPRGHYSQEFSFSHCTTSFAFDDLYPHPLARTGPQPKRRSRMSKCLTRDERNRPRSGKPCSRPGGQLPRVPSATDQKWPQT